MIRDLMCSDTLPSVCAHKRGDLVIPVYKTGFDMTVVRVIPEKLPPNSYTHVHAAHKILEDKVQIYAQAANQSNEIHEAMRNEDPHLDSELDVFPDPVSPPTRKFTPITDSDSGWSYRESENAQHFYDFEGDPEPGRVSRRAYHSVACDETEMRETNNSCAGVIHMEPHRRTTPDHPQKWKLTESDPFKIRTENGLEYPPMGGDFSLAQFDLGTKIIYPSIPTVSEEVSAVGNRTITMPRGVENDRVLCLNSRNQRSISCQTIPQELLDDVDYRAVQYEHDPVRTVGTFGNLSSFEFQVRPEKHRFFPDTVKCTARTLCKDIRCELGCATMDYISVLPTNRDPDTISKAYNKWERIVTNSISSVNAKPSDMSNQGCVGHYLKAKISMTAANAPGFQVPVTPSPGR